MNDPRRVYVTDGDLRYAQACSDGRWRTYLGTPGSATELGEYVDEDAAVSALRNTCPVRAYISKASAKV